MCKKNFTSTTGGLGSIFRTVLISSWRPPLPFAGCTPTTPQSSGSKSRRRILEVILIGCAMNALCAIRQLIDLRSQDEIAFAQAVDFVRPDRDLHSAPGKTDVRMMTLLFRQLADSVGEG